jgi:hypothetical protein
MLEEGRLVEIGMGEQNPYMPAAAKVIKLIEGLLLVVRRSQYYPKVVKPIKS